MSSSSGVEVIVEDLSDHPVCSHGPTLLFRRSKSKELFFACSACRNRRECSFFILQKDWLQKRHKITNIKTNKYLYDAIHDDTLLHKIKNAPKIERAYCHTCSSLFLVSQDENTHSKHDTEQNIEDDKLQHPSRLLKSLENNKKEAQYFFTDEAVNTIITALSKNKLRNIICIGVPRLHEHIQKMGNQKKMTSILLDIDARHRSFYERKKFCHYNMFNNHFFDGKTEEKIFENFLQKCCGHNIGIIMDPPFGGRIEPLGQTLLEISKLANVFGGTNEPYLPTLLVLPYFMEPQVENHISVLKMCDYQITYENHSKFQNKKASKQGSIVRLFTNINLSKFPLPAAEGYKFCKKCAKWVGSWNEHCSICNSCTSKNGRAYVHCEICVRCVKASWKHCFRCEKCCLIEHDCDVVLKKREFEKMCFNCNKSGHIKSECLKFNKGKRKLDDEIKPQVKKPHLETSQSTQSPSNVISLTKKQNKKKERQARIRENLEKP